MIGSLQFTPMNRLLIALVLALPLSAAAQVRLDGSPSQVKGTLPIANGGTGATSLTAAKCVRVNAGGTALEAHSGDCATATGDIEGVTAGDGLTGGGTSGTVSLAVGVTAPITVAADAIALNQNAGTDVTADLEEEAHETEHRENGADELLGENLGTACAENEILKANATGGLGCAADNDSGGATAWSAIGDAAGDGSIDLVATEQDITAANDTANDEILELSNTDADRANTVTTFQISDADQDDANAVYQRMVSDIDGTPRVDYEFSQTGFTAVLPINPPAEAYDATGWNSDTGAPQKDAVRDQFEAEPSATRTLTNKTLTAADNVIEADTGDSATSFFSAGTLELARGGTNQSSWTASRCVQVNAGGTALESAAAACGSGGGTEVDIQLFEVADTGTDWTLPTDGQWITVTACAGGGGGGGGTGNAVSNVRGGGGGGGGGFCATRTFQASDISSPVTVTVGDGGTGGTAGSSAAGGDGSAGGTSQFGSYIIVRGGGGGAGNAAGAAGGAGAGCTTAGASATGTTGVNSGDCFVAANSTTQVATAVGGGSVTADSNGSFGFGSYAGGAAGATSSSTGAALAADSAGGTSFFSGAGGGPGGGVNNANPGTAQNGGAGGNAGPAVAGLNGGGGAAGATASACGAGGEGQPGNAAINTFRPGGQGGGGGASKNSTTGCNGGAGGYGGGGGGGGGGGTNVGGAGGDGGDGYVLIVTHF